MGMSLKQFEEEGRELIFDFVFAPGVILIGMIFIGTTIDTALKTQNTFAYIFAGVGGVPAIIAYLFGKLKKKGWLK